MIAVTQTETSKDIWTFEDYLLLPDDGKRYEILSGDLLEMPSPSGLHQLIVSRLVFLLSLWVSTRVPGLILTAPMDVVLENSADVVQPDLLFIAEDQMQIFDSSGAVHGSPRLIIEVLSPSTARHDRSDKLIAYERAGVHEYWIVNPKAGTIEIYHLDGNEYQLAGEYIQDETPVSPVLGALEFSVSQLFVVASS